MRKSQGDRRVVERVERNSLIFKLGVFAIVAMFAPIPLRYLLPLFGPLMPDDPTGMHVGLTLAMFALQFLLFVLFLLAARLLLCTAKALAFLFAIDGLIILVLYAVRIDRGDDEVVLISQTPLIITASYYVYCRARKLI